MATETAPPLARLWRVYREKGLAGAWFGVLSRAGYRRLALLERTLAEPVTEAPPLVEAAIRRLEPADQGAFEALGQGGARDFRSRIERGHQCWGAWCDGSLRHVAWIAVREVWVEYLACRLLLDAGVAYVYRAYTEPGYRRLGLGAAAHSRSLKALQQRGYRLVVSAVLPDNPWAFPPWIKTGYRRVGVARSIGAGRQRRLFVTPSDHSGMHRGWRFGSPCGDRAADEDGMA